MTPKALNSGRFERRHHLLGDVVTLLLVDLANGSSSLEIFGPFARPPRNNFV